MNIQIGIVILNYKNIYDTVECIESLKNVSVENGVNVNII